MIDYRPIFILFFEGRKNIKDYVKQSNQTTFHAWRHNGACKQESCMCNQEGSHATNQEGNCHHQIPHQPQAAR